MLIFPPNYVYLIYFANSYVFRRFCVDFLQFYMFDVCLSANGIFYQLIWQKKKPLRQTCFYFHLNNNSTLMVAVNSTCQLKSPKKFDSECLILPHKTNDLFRIVRNSSIRFKRIHSINTHLICWCTVVSLDCYLWITVTMENIKSLVRIKDDFSVGIRWNDSQETATTTKRIRCLQDSHSKCSFTLKLNH